jgi:hypothetical protein
MKNTVLVTECPKLTPYFVHLRSKYDPVHAAAIATYAPSSQSDTTLYLVQRLQFSGFSHQLK